MRTRRVGRRGIALSFVGWELEVVVVVVVVLVVGVPTVLCVERELDRVKRMMGVDCGMDL